MKQKLNTTICTIILICNLACARQPVIPERVKAFCIDFNWSGKGYIDISLPGDFANADAATHMQWYKDHGVNTIQTFCVSHNGYAWYDSKIVPKVPGLKNNFLKEMVDMGHKNDMLVMGYFSPSTNVRWMQENPNEVYHNNSMFHIIYTKKYLTYLDAVIREAVSQTGIDGFMIDALFAPPIDTKGHVEWKPCEKEMYKELFGKPLPQQIDSLTEIAFQRKAMERCWSTIYKAAKETNPNCIIWLTCHNLQHPQLEGTQVLKQADWVMNESCEPDKLLKTKNRIGKHTKLIQCVVGWGEQHNAKSIFENKDFDEMGFYGFAWPDSATTLPPTMKNAGDNSRIIGNARNIEEVKKIYTKK